MKMFFIFLFALFCGPSLSFATEGKINLLLMTEAFPPLTIEKPDHVEGLSIELLNRLFDRINHTQDARQTRVLPWARAYQNLQEQPNACLFATARTPQREDLFSWVGPIAPLRMVLFAKKSRQIKIDRAEQLNNYRIGTVRDGAAENLIVTKGVPISALDRATTAKINLKKLARDRIDLFVFIESVGKHYLKELGYNPNLFETVYVLKKIDLYYAFNLQTPKPFITKLQNTYDQLRAEGVYQDLYSQYLD